MRIIVHMWRVRWKESNTVFEETCRDEDSARSFFTRKCELYYKYVDVKCVVLQKRENEYSDNFVNIAHLGVKNEPT